MPDSEIWYGGHRLLLHENPDGTFSPGVYGGAGGAAALVPTAVKTTNYTAVVKDFVPVDTTSGAVTVTLPTAPADGSLIGIKLVILGAGNSVTIARGGSDVFNKAGGATSLTLSRLNQSVLLQYKATGAIWYVTTADNSLAIGTDVQAFSADLAAIAALTSAADKFPYAIGSGTWALANATAAGRAMLAAADATAQRALLGPTFYASTAAELVTAVAALPATGGIIQCANGVFTFTAGQLDLRNKTGVYIRGVAGETSGVDAGTTFKYTGTGSASIFLMGDTLGCIFEDIDFVYTNTGFTGSLIDFQSATLQANKIRFLRCQFWGSHAAGQTARLVNLNTAINVVFDSCDFNGGGYQVYGHRTVAITGVSVANPTVITATAHGFTTGDGVGIGGTSVTASTALNSFGSGAQAGWTITVTDADHFTVPTNVTATSVVTGFAQDQTKDFANEITLRDCAFSNAVLWPLYNGGESWSVRDPRIQPRYDGSVGFYSHDAGASILGLFISGAWAGDQSTSGTTESYINFFGSGLTIIGGRWGGKSNTTTSLVKFDGDGNDGYAIIGNSLFHMAYGIEFGTTVSHLRGVIIGNSANGNGAVTFTPAHGTLPNHMALIDTSGPTTDAIWFTGATGNSAFQFDGDVTTRFYRNGAGTIYSPVTTLEVAGDFYTGFGQTAGTHIRGSSGGTVAGVHPNGSNASIEFWVDGKGATPDVGGVRIGANAANGGLLNVVRSFSLTGIISPTQLTANTDNWAPTSVASAYLVRVNIDAARNLTGIVAPTNNLLGQTLWLYNTTAFTLTLVHDATSTAANRFFCPNKANYALLQGASVQLIYSATDSRWIVLAGGA